MALDGTLVKRELALRGISLVGLCRATHLSYPRLLRGLLGGYGVRLRDDEIEALARYLEVPTATLFTRERGGKAKAAKVGS